MKHKSVAIAFEDLLARVLEGSDSKWRAVLGVNHERLDEIERDLAAISRGDVDDGDEEGLLEEANNLDAKLILSLTGSWWIVSWPDHVVVPRYNSDANYRQVSGCEEAVQFADLEYGA